MKEFTAYGIEPKQYEHEIAGGDHHILKDIKTKRNAFLYAKKESKKEEWYEVMINEKDEIGNVVGCWYFANGRMKWDCCL